MSRRSFEVECAAAAAPGFLVPRPLPLFRAVCLRLGAKFATFILIDVRSGVGTNDGWSDARTDSGRDIIEEDITEDHTRLIVGAWLGAWASSFTLATSSSSRSIFTSIR